MRLDRKHESIIRLALHANTPEGEWQASAIALFRVMRAAGVTADELCAALLAPMVTWPAMPFGKYKGKRLPEVPLPYLRWVLTLGNLETHLRASIADFVMAVRLGGVSEFTEVE